MARGVVRQQYNFLPPNDAKLSQQQYKAHIRQAIEDLLLEGEFLMGGVDDQVNNSNNILCHHTNSTAGAYKQFLQCSP